MQKITQWIAQILNFMLGRMSWSRPPWLRYLNQQQSNNPKTTYFILFLLLSSSAGYGYYHSLPVPEQVSADVQNIAVASNDPNATPSPLRIRFKLHGQATSVAALEKLDQPLNQQIEISPAVKGNWRWENEHTLLFQAKKRWPAEQTYRLKFKPTLFAPQIQLAQYQTEFQTPKFSAKLDSLRFYKDPKQSEIHNVIASVSFSHPVDAVSFESTLLLSSKPNNSKNKNSAKHYSFKISYDKSKRQAFVHSETLPIEADESYLYLQLASGVKSLVGSAKTRQELSDKVVIPSSSTFFRLEKAESKIVRNQQKNSEPEQILLLEFSDGVSAKALQKNLKALLLPLKANTSRYNRHWKNIAEIPDNILKHATPLKLQAIDSDKTHPTLHSFRFNAPEGRQLYLQIKNGLTSSGGFNLSRSSTKLITAPRYPKEAKIAFEGALISSGGEKKIGFVSRGIKALKIDIMQLLPSQIHHLISQTSGDIKNPAFHSQWNFNEQNISRAHSEIQRLNFTHPSKALYSSLDLDRYLKQSHFKSGLFFIKIQGWDPERKQPIYAAQDQRLIIITDLGLLVKENADQSHHLFVQSIQQGLPVAGATVEVLGKNGLPIISAISDQQGQAYFPNLKDFRGAQAPTVYLVSKDGDSAFIPYRRSERQINYSRFDVGGVRTQQQDRSGLNAYLFSDRGLYRPGEEVHLAAIVKRHNWQPLENMPVEIQIRDPRGTDLMRKKVSLSPTGFIDWSLQTEALSAIGNYTASLYLVKDRQRWGTLLGTTTFKVQEFQPDRMKISSKITGQQHRGWYQPNDLKAAVQLENLFGTPAQNRTVKATMQLTSANFYFKDFKEFTFTDPLRSPNNRRLQINTPLKTQKTDQQGKASFTLDLSAYHRGSYQLAVNSEGFDTGEGRSVHSRSSVLVSPLHHLVGFKADGDLNFLHKNGQRTVKFIAINADLKPIALSKLRKNLLQQRYISTLVKQHNGSFKYQSSRKESQLNSEPFAIAAAGTELLLPSDEAGDYILELVNAQNEKIARVFYSVAGAGNLSRSLEKNAELQVKLDKKSYSSGQTIQVQITAPYSGSGLISIERDKVYAYQWFKTDSNSSLQTIQVPAKLEGNAYINVAFIRAPDSKEIFTSPLSYSAVPFAIDRERREIQIELQSAEKIAPGDTLTVRYRSSKTAKIALFAVDAGILQVARYHTPDPLAHFLKKQALEVNTLQMVDLILPEYRLAMELAAAGGGQAQRALGKNINPFRRHTEKPVAFWSGILNADDKEREQQFKIPDYFNGTLKIMAVAVSASAVGNTEKEVIVKGPFVISPNAPLMVTPSDQFKVTVGIANNLEESEQGNNPEEIQVTLKTSEHLNVIGSASQTLNIAAGSEGKVSFWLKAGEKLGSAQLNFSVSHANRNSQLSSSLSVRPATPYRTTLISGYHASGSADIKLTRQLLSDLAQQSAAASHSPLLMVEGLSSYLQNFAHGCAEQMVSKVFPYLGLLKHPNYSVDQDKLNRDFKQVINALRSRQTNSGAFRFWAGQAVTAGLDFPSVYISHFLTDAKELGYPVPKDLLEKALDYLASIARNSSSSLESARLRAYAIYLLSRNQILSSNQLIDLYSELEKNHPNNWLNDITSTYMAASFQLLKNRPLQQKMLAGYQFGSEKKALSSDFDSQLSQDAQYLYLLAKHFPTQFKQNVDEQALMTLIEPLNKGQYNTLSAAYSMLALGAYTRQFKNAANDQNIHISSLSAGKPKALDLKITTSAKAELPHNAEEVQFETEKNIFYLLTQSGYEKSTKTNKEIRNGMEIYRDYYNKNGEPISNATIGSEVEVRIRIRALSQNKIDNIAIIDLLPAGFEVINNSFKQLTPNYSGSQHHEIREDRLVIYTGINKNLSEYRYRAKITTQGDFSVPAIDARSMYQRQLHARSATTRFSVTD